MAFAFICEGQRAEFVVLQRAKGEIVLSQKEYSLTSDKQTFIVDFKANTDFEITESDNTWLHRIQTKAMEEYQLEYSVDVNESFYSRTDTITIKNIERGTIAIENV